MKDVLQNFGVILIMVGALILIVGFISGNGGNVTMLCCSLFVVVAGLVAYLVMTRKR